jgi:PAS domain S-box-containing protein
MTESDLAQIERERQRAGEELRRNDELLRAVAEEVPDAIFVKDRSGKYLLFNKAASQLTGKPAADVLGHDDTAIFDLDSARAVMDNDRQVMASGVAATKEEELTAAGVTRTYLATKAPYRDGQGNVAGVIGISRDITERKRAEETLRSSERNLATLAEKSLQGIAIFQGNKMVYANPAECAIVGYPVEELQAMSREQFLALVHPLDRPIAEERARKRLAGEEISPEVELRIVRKDGAMRWIQAFNNTIEFNGQPAILSTCIDVTERKQAEEALRESERLLRQVMDALPVGVVVINLTGDVILGNLASNRIWGGMITAGAERYAKSKGWWHDTGKAIGPDEWASVRAIRNGQTSVNELVDIETFAGVRKFMRNSAAPIRDDDQAISGAVVINEDVTEVLHLEDQFRQAQKMEAVGHLAGGVAHDFNNLLTIINGYSSIIQTQLPADSPMRALVREIGQAGERAASLTRQLLAFSRKQVLELKVLNLNAIVTDTAKMLKRLIGEDIDLNTVLDPGLGRTKADPGQLEQVLMNLAVNARDAMPQGGKLTIETANADLDEAYTRRVPDLRPGSYVALTVSDTGIGMDEATKVRIFEPFFTTKGLGKGTGLGLATVYGIVKQSNGHVAVYSEPGQGTTFKIYLPVVEEVMRSGKSHAGLITTLHGTETILLAEDEPALRALARHVLQMHGYTVLEAGQSDKALSIAEGYRGTIHLLVTDVVMPVMSGRQLAERLAAVRPGVKVLYLSGYTDDAVVRHGVLQAETAFLQKPFTPASLAAKVREVLDQEGGEGA